ASSSHWDLESVGMFESPADDPLIKSLWVYRLLVSTDVHACDFLTSFTAQAFVCVRQCPPSWLSVWLSPWFHPLAVLETPATCLQPSKVVCAAWTSLNS